MLVNRFSVKPGAGSIATKFLQKNKKKQSENSLKLNLSNIVKNSKERNKDTLSHIHIGVLTAKSSNNHPSQN